MRTRSGRTRTVSRITKALVGDEVYLCADVMDIPDGTDARIKIIEKDADGQDDDVATLTATMSGGKIECAWKVVYMEDNDDSNSEQERAEKGYTLPEYAFTVECGGVTSEESGQLDVRGWVNVKFNDNDYKLLKDCKFYIYSDDWESGDVEFKDNVLNFNELPFLTNKKWNLGVRF